MDMTNDNLIQQISDLTEECYTRGTRIAELESKLAGVRAIMNKSRNPDVPWEDFLGSYLGGVMDEIDAALAETEGENDE